MKTILLALAALALSGCAVYTTPYPAVVYQDPWPVRVPIYQPVVIPQQPAVIYEDNRQYHYHQQQPKKKP